MVEQVLQQLRGLMDRSAGSPIVLASGARRAFRGRGPLAHAEVRELERSSGLVFPSEYSLLLATVGPAECFIDETGSATLEIHDPRDVPSAYADFFAAPSELRSFFPIACDNRLQEIVALALGRSGPRNVLVVSHEVPPEDWPALADEVELTSIEDWIREALATDGHLRPH